MWLTLMSISAAALLVRLWCGALSESTLNEHNIVLDQLTCKTCKTVDYSLCVWLVIAWEGNYHIRLVLHTTQVCAGVKSTWRGGLHTCVYSSYTRPHSRVLCRLVHL